MRKDLRLKVDFEIEIEIAIEIEVAVEVKIENEIEIETRSSWNFSLKTPETNGLLVDLSDSFADPRSPASDPSRKHQTWQRTGRNEVEIKTMTDKKDEYKRK